MSDGEELAHHLLNDLVLKGAILLAAVLVFALGALFLWRRLGR
ncbi:hypothetical protein [Amycolatopsis acidicola]|nr:hypothetical protein [Amycolatopsis acidicola]